jgi:hypothetical protein
MTFFTAINYKNRDTRWYAVAAFSSCMEETEETIVQASSNRTKFASINISAAIKPWLKTFITIINRNCQKNKFKKERANICLFGKSITI